MSQTFKENCVKSLCDPAISMVNFKVNNYEIGTPCYYFIAKYIMDDKIKCIVDGSVKNGTAAEYDSSNNTIYGSEADIQFLDQKSTIVHESTHAYFDLAKGFKKDLAINILWNEVCAFLAAQIYRMVTKPNEIVFGGKDPNVVAYNVVKTKGIGPRPCNGTSPIVFTSDDVAPLVASLKQHELYKNRVNTASPIDGIP